MGQEPISREEKARGHFEGRESKNQDKVICPGEDIPSEGVCGHSSLRVKVLPQKMFAAAIVQTPTNQAICCGSRLAI